MGRPSSRSLTAIATSFCRFANGNLVDANHNRCGRAGQRELPGHVPAMSNSLDCLPIEVQFFSDGFDFVLSRNAGRPYKANRFV